MKLSDAPLESIIRGPYSLIEIHATVSHFLSQEEALLRCEALRHAIEQLLLKLTRPHYDRRQQRASPALPQQDPCVSVDWRYVRGEECMC